MAKIVLTKHQGIAVLHKFGIHRIDGTPIEEMKLPSLKEYFKTFLKEDKN